MAAEPQREARGHYQTRGPGTDGVTESLIQALLSLSAGGGAPRAGRAPSPAEAFPPAGCGERRPRRSTTRLRGWSGHQHRPRKRHSGAASAPAAPSPLRHARPAAPRPRGPHKGPRGRDPARRPLAYLRPRGMLGAVRGGPQYGEPPTLDPGSAAMSGAGAVAELARPRACSAGGGEGAGTGIGIVVPAGFGCWRLWGGGADGAAVAWLPSGRLFHAEPWNHPGWKRPSTSSSPTICLALPL